MSTKDEKDWLRAILEGKVKPGDAEWKRIWQEEDFTGVRRVLREVGMRKKDELVADRQKMWQAIEQYRGEGKNRRRVSIWRWAEFTREERSACCKSNPRDRGRNSTCRVAYGTRGKNRFIHDFG